MRPPYEPDPAVFLRKHVEREAQIARARRDYETEKDRLCRIFDEGAARSGVVIVDEPGK